MPGIVEKNPFLMRNPCSSAHMPEEPEFFRSGAKIRKIFLAFRPSAGLCKR